MRSNRTHEPRVAQEFTIIKNIAWHDSMYLSIAAVLYAGIDEQALRPARATGRRPSLSTTRRSGGRLREVAVDEPDLGAQHLRGFCGPLTGPRSLSPGRQEAGAPSCEFSSGSRIRVVKAVRSMQSLTPAKLYSQDTLLSGCRKTSRTWRRHSGRASRKRTPWCASDTSPGSGTWPPPLRPTSEMVW
jgi:hypothetical protein